MSAVTDGAPHPAELYVAVVHTADGVRFAAAGSRPAVVRRLAEYAGRRADDTLWPEQARHLRGLLARGEPEAAVEVYFGLVGGRWDEEWLVTAVVPLGATSEVDALLDAVVPPADARRSNETALRAPAVG